MHNLPFLSKQDTFKKPIQLTSAEVPCFESTEERAQYCLKNEWTLEDFCLSRGLAVISKDYKYIMEIGNKKYSLQDPGIQRQSIQTMEDVFQLVQHPGLLS